LVFHTAPPHFLNILKLHSIKQSWNEDLNENKNSKIPSSHWLEGIFILPIPSNLLVFYLFIHRWHFKKRNADYIWLSCMQDDK
jgi:hypothetical protein